MKGLILAIILAFLPAVTLYAGEVVMYFIPHLEIQEQAPVLLRDCIRAEGSREDVSKLYNLEIPRELYEDGFLDRRELLMFIAARTGLKGVIYGSSSRITVLPVPEQDPGAELVFQGDIVTVSAGTSRISVELSGVAQRNGALGDLIPVKVNASRIIQGEVTGKRHVRIPR